MVNRIALAVASVAISAAAWGGESPQPIAWLDSISGAEASQAGTGKLVMIYFDSPTGAYCRKMAKFTWTDKRVIAAAKAIIITRPRMQERSAEGRRYAISRFPSMVFLGPESTYLMTVDGYRPPEVMVADISKASKMEADYKALVAKAEANPTDGETVFKLAGLQIARRDYSKAEKNLLAARKLDTGGKHEAGIDLSLGTVMAEWGQVERARTLFGGIVKKHPEAEEVAPARFFLAILDLKAGSRDVALKSLAELVDDHKEDENPWAARAERVIRQLSRVRRK